MKARRYLESSVLLSFHSPSLFGLHRVSSVANQQTVTAQLVQSHLLFTTYK